MGYNQTQVGGYIQTNSLNNVVINTLLPSVPRTALLNRPPRVPTPASHHGDNEDMGKSAPLLAQSLVPPVIRVHVSRNDGFSSLPRGARNNVRKPRSSYSVEHSQVQPRLGLKQFRLDNSRVGNASVTREQSPSFQTKVSGLGGVLPWAEASHQK